MKIEAVDFFYFAMPEITEEADGSQDALVVRVAAGGLIGWGECEAAPLPSIAAFVCPMSHGACRPVASSVLGQKIETANDIARIAATVQYDSMDLLQAAHTFSGIEMALWDILGKRHGAPVWSLLGYERSYRKTPYASLLFADTPAETLERARQAAAENYRAAKFGWGPIGRADVKADADQFVAAREGLGPDADLMVDAGQIFLEDVDAAAARLPALEKARVVWLEEPFQADAMEAYAAIAARGSHVGIAGGEGAHNIPMARHLMTYGNVDFIQIDCGRIGGIGPAKQIADLAVERGVTYVNHTFTSHLALSASMQPFAGLYDHRICEYPAAPKPLAVELTSSHIERDRNGEIAAPEAPGLGIEIDLSRLAQYLVEVDMKVGGKTIYRTPRIG
jgi:L-alanine-DL-glutamate epimerase-like enolase superfamily enzyme